MRRLGLALSVAAFIVIALAIPTSASLSFEKYLIAGDTVSQMITVDVGTDKIVHLSAPSQEGIELIFPSYIIPQDNEITFELVIKTSLHLSPEVHTITINYDFEKSEIIYIQGTQNIVPEISPPLSEPSSSPPSNTTNQSCPPPPHIYATIPSYDYFYIILGILLSLIVFFLLLILKKKKEDKNEHKRN